MGDQNSCPRTASTVRGSPVSQEKSCSTHRSDRPRLWAGDVRFYVVKSGPEVGAAATFGLQFHRLVRLDVLEAGYSGIDVHYV